MVVTAKLTKTTKAYARYEYKGDAGILTWYRPLEQAGTPPPDTVEVTLAP